MHLTIALHTPTRVRIVRIFERNGEVRINLHEAAVTQNSPVKDKPSSEDGISAQDLNALADIVQALFLRYSDCQEDLRPHLEDWFLQAGIPFVQVEAKNHIQTDDPEWIGKLALALCS